tara:strand:+ start:79 stop:945 length:867 start_codon:yes stop_codon:yes gene_type:complete
MSEVLDLDSGGQDAAPDTGASDSDATNSVELFELDDTSTSAPSDDAGHSENATSDFDPAQADWLRVDPNTVPEQYQPLVPLAKNLQAQFTKTQQDLADQRNQLAQERQEWASRIQTMAAPPPPPDPIQQMREGVSEDEQRGIDAVQQIVQHQVGNHLTGLQQEVQQLRTQLATANQFVEAQQTAHIGQQVQEARTQYGNDLDSYTDQIVATTKIANPKTGQPYTVKEAYELHAGITAQNAADVRQQDTQAKRTSKRAVRQTQAVDASEEGGPLTDNEVLNGLASLGFE